MSAVLDAALSLLERNEREGDDLPIALRRFRDHIGVASTITAMQRVVADVLHRYFDTVQCTSIRISAGMLCKTCGVSLEGSLPSGARRRATDVGKLFTGKSRRHSGALHMDPQSPKIRLPPGLDRSTARVAVAHELGHFLIHRRGDTLDSFTIKLPSSQEEEALSEYAARLLLVPNICDQPVSADANVAQRCLELAQRSEVTVHSAAARLGDPDNVQRNSLKGLIMWVLNPEVSSDESVAVRLTPKWRLCGDVFIPIRRCHASRESLIGELASSKEATVIGSRCERVSIGALRGTFRVDAVAWGSLDRGRRAVLSAFLET